MGKGKDIWSCVKWAKLAVAYTGISKWRAQLIINTIINNFSNGTNDSQHKKPF